MQAESKAISNDTSHRWLKWLIVTLVLAVIAFLASPSGPLGTFWRPSAQIPNPAGLQLPLLILLNIAEVITFGLGVSFLIFGYPLVRSALPASKGLTFAAYLSIGWLLANWWPHDSLHIANGLELNGLIGIEYGFHITLMVAGAILAYFFFALLRQQPTHSR
jgi:hypothetical protein